MVLWAVWGVVAVERAEVVAVCKHLYCASVAAGGRSFRVVVVGPLRLSVSVDCPTTLDCLSAGHIHGPGSVGGAMLAGVLGVVSGYGSVYPCV